MKITAILEIPEDFRLHCEIYDCNAQDVLQEFVNQVSLPRHRAGEGNGYECATSFFMDYADQLLSEKGQPADVHDHYLDKLAETVVPIRDGEQREVACRKILRQWALAVKESSSCHSTEMARHSSGAEVKPI
ncbi:hypothetical protein EDD80_11815 [Anseongella ginsenosidimutans]|uniref:Uncharacterized protein n=1 Tax=Anseongella ginsenosidimutans TaxID=496056 RepID=A0A4V2UT85_9SPHI|nr:hypothetical protein [Anseongella ginsenosidimutans]QEC51958.1 hypothetical protein FRZ59_06170 [Anseongella ginsenosidimutans]TCS84746.1 hypothetical protein EDD80_11815 [Anseongella ginsenosidimutans]